MVFMSLIQISHVPMKLRALPGVHACLSCRASKVLSPSWSSPQRFCFTVQVGPGHQNFKSNPSYFKWIQVIALNYPFCCCCCCCFSCCYFSSPCVYHLSVPTSHPIITGVLSMWQLSPRILYRFVLQWSSYYTFMAPLQSPMRPRLRQAHGQLIKSLSLSLFMSHMLYLWWGALTHIVNQGWVQKDEVLSMKAEIKTLFQYRQVTRGKNVVKLDVNKNL